MITGLVSFNIAQLKGADEQFQELFRIFKENFRLEELDEVLCMNLLWSMAKQIQSINIESFKTIIDNITNTLKI